MNEVHQSQQIKVAGKKPKSLRRDNYKAVLDLFRQSGQLTVKEISDQISLSKTSISKILTTMLEHEDIVLVGKGESTEYGGKRPYIYAFNDKKSCCICLTFWERGCEGRIIDLNYRCLTSTTFEQEEMLSEDELIHHLAAAINHLLVSVGVEENRVLVIALGSAGIIDDSGVLVQPMRYCRYGRNFSVVERLKAVLTLDVPIFYDNVSRFSAYYELLNHPERKNGGVMVISSDGKRVGGAMIHNGVFYRGFDNMAGEFGHVTVASGKKLRCDCGDYGCFEAVISEKNMGERLRELAENYPDSLLKEEQESFSYKKLFDAVNADDALAVRLLDEVVEAFRRVINNAKLLLNPAEIILQDVYAYPCDYFRRCLEDILKSGSFQSSCAITYSDVDYVTSTFMGSALFCFDWIYQ